MLMQSVPGGLSAPRGDHGYLSGDRVTVEAEVDGRAVSFRAVVVRVHPDALWIALPSPDPRVAQFQPGQAVSLASSRDGGSVVSGSTFLHAVAAEPERLFAITRPVDAQEMERSRYVRAEVARTIRFIAINDASADGLEMTSVTVSTAGVLVETDKFLAVGDKLTLDLVLEPGDALRLEAQVVRIADPPKRRAPHGEPAPYRVAIRFIEPAPGDHDRIVRHLLAAQHPDYASGRQADGMRERPHNTPEAA